MLDQEARDRISQLVADARRFASSFSPEDAAMLLGHLQSTLEEIPTRR